jgi:hypothetical protein
MAALISRKYLQYGLSARAFGPNIIYNGNTALGGVTVTSGPSITTDISSAAQPQQQLPVTPCRIYLASASFPTTTLRGSIHRKASQKRLASILSGDTSWVLRL